MQVFKLWLWKKLSRSELSRKVNERVNKGNEWNPGEVFFYMCQE